MTWLRLSRSALPTLRPLLLLSLTLVFFSCDSALKETSGANQKNNGPLDKIHSLTRDLYLGNGLTLTSNDIYSTEFTSGFRSRGLAVMLRTSLPVTPGLNDSARVFSHTHTHVHDDPRIPISAPNSEFYVLESSSRTEIRIGSNKEIRPPGPVVYRLQSEIGGAAMKKDGKTEVLIPIVAPFWNIAIDSVTARLHLMRAIDPSSISFRAVHTLLERGKVESVVEGNAFAKLEFEEGGGRRPVILVVTKGPVKAGEGLYLLASWPDP